MPPKKNIQKKEHDEYKKKCQTSLIFNEDMPTTMQGMEEQESNYFTKEAHERDKKMQDIFNECIMRMQIRISEEVCVDKNAEVFFNAGQYADGSYDANSCLFDFEGKKFSFQKMMTAYLKQKKFKSLVLSMKVDTEMRQSKTSKSIDEMEKQMDALKQKTETILKEASEASEKVNLIQANIEKN